MWISSCGFLLALAGAAPAMGEEGALRRIQSAEETSRQGALFQHFSSRLAEVEAAERKLGVEQVQGRFLRGVQERLDREQIAFGEIFGAMTPESALALKEKIRSLYADLGVGSGLRALRNAERRFAQVTDQLGALFRELRTADVVTRLERALSEAGGVSKLARGVEREHLSRVNEWGFFRWLVPFHLTADLWGGFGPRETPLYLRILLTPLALVGDVVLLPLQVVFVAGFIVADWII